MYIIASNVWGLTRFSKNNSVMKPTAINKKAKKVITLLLLGLASPSPQSIFDKKPIIVLDDLVEMELLYHQILRSQMLQTELLQVSRQMLLVPLLT
jgi:hypothetical protein